MFTTFRTHLARNIIGYISLFIVLGGTSYAAATLSKGSVKSKHIAGKAIKSRHLANDSVKSGQIKDGTIRSKDFKKSDLNKIKSQVNEHVDGKIGPQGPQGPKGQQGVQGLQGSQGVPGLSGYETEVAESSLTTNNKAAEATCGAGKKPIGGGYSIVGGNGEDQNISVRASAPTDNGWVVSAVDTDPGGMNDQAWKIVVKADCAEVE